MLLSVLAMVCGFAVLVWAADRFVLGASGIARSAGISPLVIGLTVVAMGTAAPELLVSATAAVAGSPSLAIGNAIGSNITNVGLVLGVTALISPLTVHSKIVRRELPVLLLTMLAAFAMIAHDNRLDRLDGLLLLGGLVFMLGWMAREGLRESAQRDPLSTEIDAELPPALSLAASIAWFAVGLAGLIGGSRFLVWGAVDLAQRFGVSELVIGLTIIAFGTSLPELAASIVAATRNEHDIAVGNVIGSNLFNLLGVLGLPAAIAPSTCSPAVVQRDFPIMLGLTVLLLVFARGFGERGRLGRVKGALLVGCFLAYLVVLYRASTAA